MKRNCIKSLLATFMALLATGSIYAYDIETNGVYYNITDAVAQTVEVTYAENGNGNAAFITAQ